MAGLGSLFIDLLARTGKFETDIGRAAKIADRRAKEIQRSFQQAAAKINSELEKGFKQTPARLSQLAAGLGFGISISTVLEETAKAERAMAALNNAVKNNGGAAGFTAKELASLSSELQQVSIYADDSIQEMQALLLTFREIRGTQFERAQSAVLDLATALGQDLKSAAMLVGRALADPVSGMNKLARSGIILTDAHKKLIKQMAETGRMSEAQSEILRQLESRFGGAAKSARDSFGGALEALKNAFGDLLEQKDGLPKLTEKVNEMIEALSAPETQERIDETGSFLIDLFDILTDLGKLVSAPNRAQTNWLFDFFDGTIDRAKELKATLLDRSLAENIKQLFYGQARANNFEPAGPRPVAAAGPSVPATPPSEEFIRLSEKLQEQIALYGKVGKAAEISYAIQSGALDELSKSEQQQLLALARRYDAVVKTVDAQKKAAEEQKKAAEEIRKMTESVEEQIATFGKGETAVLQYRLAHGDLAKAFSQAGEDDALNRKIEDLTDQLESMDSASINAARSMSEFDTSLRQGLDAFGEDFEERFVRAGENTDDLRDKLIDLTLQLEIIKEAAEGAAEAISDFASQNSESLDQGLESFEKDFEERFLKISENLTVFQEQAARNTQDIIADALVSGFEDGADGILKAFGDMIIKLTAQAVAADIAKRLFGDPSVSGDGWLGIAATAAKAWFGGGRAIGGPVLAGTTYRINEREPEFFRPRVGGNIIPLSKMPNMGRGMVVNQNFTVRTESGERVSRSTEQQIAAAASRGMAMASRRNN